MNDIITCETTPMPHQQMLAELYALKLVHAYFNEQGTCKTWLGINDFTISYLKGETDTLVVIGPSGVERNWHLKEIPLHMKRSVQERAHIFVWNTKTAGSQREARRRKAAEAHVGGPLIVLMSYSAACTVKGKAWLKEKILKKRKCFYLLDESQFIKNPGSKRTMALVASGAYADRKRIMTGTPMGANGPMDLYAQIMFLDDTFWKRHGIKDYQIFKAFFADWLPMDGWMKILRFKNMELLSEWLKEISCRVLKSEVLKDLPERMYTRQYLEMPAEHRRVYEALRDKLRAQLQSGDMVEVRNPLTLRSKFMQVCCGYIAVDKGEPFELIDGSLPRMDSAVEWLEAGNSQAIVWTRFRMDVDQFEKRLGDRMARYDGKLSPEARGRELEAFQKGDKQYFVANPQVGGTGLTINEADRALVYAMRDDPIELKQALDRNHRPGQKNAVNYCFMVAQDTVDERIIDRHVKNNEISCEVLGDKILEWI